MRFQLSRRDIRINRRTAKAILHGWIELRRGVCACTHCGRPIFAKIEQLHNDVCWCKNPMSLHAGANLEETVKWYGSLPSDIRSELKELEAAWNTFLVTTTQARWRQHQARRDCT